MPENDHFNKIYWFVCALCAFGAAFTTFLVIVLPPEERKAVVNIALTFWLSSAVSGGIGYLIGSSASAKKNTDAAPGTASATFTASVQTDSADAVKKS